nr:EOG090X0D2W [Polyphemus pediculus]
MIRRPPRSTRSEFYSPTINYTIFAEGSSSDENLDEDEAKEALDWRSRTAAKAVEKSVQRNQARQAALKALTEDPTVFQYDELYDEMQQKKEEKKPVQTEKKPKYIKQLLRSAEQRKIETEQRTERKVQKERENEGDMFNDKESFITPAYKAKLAELKKVEEEERLKDHMEAILDVTKQRDLSGFYRHYYNQTFDETKEKAETVIPATLKKEINDHEPKNPRQYRQRREESPERLKDHMEAILDVTKQRDLSGFYRHYYNQTFDETKEKAETVIPATLKKEINDHEPKNPRQYRQRREESPEPQEPEESSSNQKVQETNEDGEDLEETDTTSKKKELRPAASASLVSAAASDRVAAADRAIKTKELIKKEKPVESEESSDESRPSSPVKAAEEEIAIPKVKIDIWKKRTCGQSFNEAVQRYQARKEAREKGLVAWP